MQLLETGSIAAIMIFGTVTRQPAVIDVALIVALMAAFVGLAFVRSISPGGRGQDE